MEVLQLKVRGACTDDEDGEDDDDDDGWDVSDDDDDDGSGDEASAWNEDETARRGLYIHRGKTLENPITVMICHRVAALAEILAIRNGGKAHPWYGRVQTRIAERLAQT